MGKEVLREELSAVEILHDEAALLAHEQAAALEKVSSILDLSH